MIIKLKHFQFIIFAFLIIASSCNSGKEKETNHLLLYPELKPPFRIGVNQISDKDSIPELQLNFKNKLVNDEKSQSQILQFEYKNNWKVCYKINTDKQFDILIVQQTNPSDAHSLMLITTQKDNPDNVISALIVGLENYSENEEKIESEDWNSFINSDLSINVRKEYQAIFNTEIGKNETFSERVNTKTNVTEVEEKYQIKDDGKISFIDKAIFSKPSIQQKELSYRAVIAFKSSNEELDDPMNDEWLLNNVEIQNTCSYQNIFFIQAYDNFGQVFITDNFGNIMDTIDITFATNKILKGYVMIHSKYTPNYIDYSDKKTVLTAISSYFNINLLLDE